MNDEDIMDFFKKITKLENEEKNSQQFLRDKYPGLFPPEKFKPKD